MKLRNLATGASLLALAVASCCAPSETASPPWVAPQTAEVSTIAYIAYIAVTIISLIVASALLKQPKKKDTSAVPSTLASRGLRLPYPIGRDMIGYGFGWAGDDLAESVEEATGSGGKGSIFGGRNPTQTVWYVPAWHQLCPGVATKLLSIEDNGEEVWRFDPPLDPTNTPSGSEVETDIGTFEIYWGERSQPISAFLSEHLGVASRWPGLCHIVWTRARVGTSKIWPHRKYEVEKMFPCMPGLSCNYLLDNGTSRGVNPAWVLYGMFSGGTPDGCDFDLDQVDQTFLDDLCALCVAEHLPMNSSVNNGDSADAIIQGMLADLGVMLVDNRGVLTGSILRPPTLASPILDDSSLTSPETERVINRSPDPVRSTVFTFRDSSIRWNDNDVSYENDFGENRDTSNPLSVSLTIPTDYPTAEKISARRIQELSGDVSFQTFHAMRNSSRMLPGYPFLFEGQPYRISSVQRSTTSAVTVIEAFFDSYAVTPVIYGEDVIPPVTGQDPVAADLAVSWFEIPSEVSGAATAAISVLRIRAHSSISGANIWISPDGGSYVLIGQQNTSCAGGELLEDWGLSGLVGADVVEVGQTFEAWSTDALNVRNLSDPDEAATWQSGSQVLVINDEVFFLRNLTTIPISPWTSATSISTGTRRLPTTPNGFSYIATTTGTTGSTEPVWPRTRLETVVDGSVTWEARGYVFRLDGAIRARLGTAKQAHTAGDVVFIAPYSASILSLTSALLTPGSDICVKSQPVAGRQPLDLTAITAVCHRFEGIASTDTFWTTEVGDTMMTHTGDRLIF